MSHELTVDPTACDGHGVCCDLAPDLLTRDDWGFPMLAQGHVPPELLSQVRRAASACPKLALHLRRRDRASVIMPTRRPTGLDRHQPA